MYKEHCRELTIIRHGDKRSRKARTEERADAYTYRF